MQTFLFDIKVGLISSNVPYVIGSFKSFFNLIAVNCAVVLSILTKVVVQFGLRAKLVGISTGTVHLCNWADFREVL